MPIVAFYDLRLSMASIEKFLSYIQSDGKHGLYQLFPPALINKYNELKELPYESYRLDDKRYEYFTGKVNFNKAKVTDIGANIGYFSYRAASEQQSEVCMYEPYADHYKALCEMQHLLDVESRTKVFNTGIGLDDINKLEQTDILLLFNVLQHAGEDFDRNYVKSVNDWEIYAINYLSKLKEKTKYLIFQNGYSWLGHSHELCCQTDIIAYTIKLLSKAGWNISNCGIVTNFNTKEYRDLNIAVTTKNPIFGTLKHLEYGIRYRLGFNVPNHRFIQRPIFICQH